MPDPPHARGRGRLRRARRAGLARLTPPDRTQLAADLGRVLLAERDAVEIGVHGRTEAAVLVPLFLDAQDGRLHAVFTKRRDDMRRHAGEISFPGGRRDDTDADLCATALREAHEEIGLHPGEVELIGALQPTSTYVTSYSVYPFVGLIDPGREWTIQAREVDHVLEFALDDIRAGQGRERLIRRGVPFRTDVYKVGDHTIWGATARMVADLIDRLAAIRPSRSAR